jgi:hypothetical protein
MNQAGTYFVDGDKIESAEWGAGAGPLILDHVHLRKRDRTMIPERVGALVFGRHRPERLQKFTLKAAGELHGSAQSITISASGACASQKATR